MRRYLLILALFPLLTSAGDAQEKTKFSRSSRVDRRGRAKTPAQ